MQTRYKKKELVRIKPWPHICPNCKGKPLRFVRSGTRIPFNAKVVVTIPDVCQNLDYTIVIRCDLCMGTGTVFK